MDYKSPFWQKIPKIYQVRLCLFIVDDLCLNHHNLNQSGIRLNMIFCWIFLFLSEVLVFTLKYHCRKAVSIAHTVLFFTITYIRWIHNCIDKEREQVLVTKVLVYAFLWTVDHSPGLQIVQSKPIPPHEVNSNNVHHI